MLSALRHFLGWLGRNGTQGFAISIFVGLALPQFAAAARPLLGVSIFVFTTLTFARADLSAMRQLVQQPSKLLLSLVWIVLAPVVLVLLPMLLFGRAALDPGLVLGLAILAAAPPIMSSPAVAMILGLDPTLLMATVLLTTALAPLLAPPLAEWVAGMPVPLDLNILIQRLALLIGGAIIGAAILRKLLGEARIRAEKPMFDGIGVIMYFVFAIAAMDGVLAAAVSDTGRVLRYLAIAFAAVGAGMLAAFLCLRTLAPVERFVLGYATLQRNMGLLVAALGSSTPQTTFLFFALAQFPIYLMPQIVKPFAQRFLARQDRAACDRPSS
jgi:bile acid:Na+ symporter, BASS family